MGVSCKRPPEGVRDQVFCRVRQCLRAVAASAVMVLAPASQAQSDHALAGANAPEFKAAFALWLEADEAGSLPRLADLAQQDNTAAQVLLAMIDKSAALQGPYVTRLPRQERIALLRQPGGLSGRNWIGVAATEAPLAALWNDLWMMRGGVEIARGFAELGEARATREALLTQLSRQDRGFPRELREADWFPESLMHLTLSRSMNAEEAAALPAGHPMRKLDGQAPDSDDIMGWLDSSALAAPLRAVCEAECPATVSECTYGLYEALGSYHSLTMMGSPAVALVSEEAYIRSPRGQQAVARRIMLMHTARLREASFKTLTKTDSCATDWLRAQYLLYHPGVRTSPVEPD